jgi:polyisoprenoid-binding protein YceI
MHPRSAATLLALLCLVTGVAARADQVNRFAIDAAQSTVSARVAFFGLAHKTARFPAISGGIALDPRQPEQIALDVSLDARALQAGDKVTLARLKGPNFFDVERHPTVRFVGRSMRITGPLTADVQGELTARGVTRGEVLKVTFDRPPDTIGGQEPVTLSGTMTIDRRHYGMTAWSLIVGNRVTIAIRARMVPG